MEHQMKVFVGTAHEFKEVAHLFSDDGIREPRSSPPQATSGEAASSPEDASLSPEIIELALNRIPLSRKQSRVWRAVVDVYPNWINVVELAKQTNLTRQEVAGVWGALGRRLANTPGWPANKWPLDEDRDDANLRRYRAHKTLVDLIKAGRIKLKQ
jgi:hypothetical protein